MSFWGKLFGSSEATKTLIDTVTDAGDKLFYTNEEKAEDMARDRSEARGMVVDWLKNTQGQNLSRRLIALSITLTWLLMYLISAGLGVASIWVDEPKQLIDSAEMIRSSSNDMGSAVMLILAFYFAAPHMGNIAEVALKRFGKTHAEKNNQLHSQ